MSASRARWQEALRRKVAQISEASCNVPSPEDRRVFTWVFAAKGLFRLWDDQNLTDQIASNRELDSVLQRFEVVLQTIKAVPYAAPTDGWWNSISPGAIMEQVRQGEVDRQTKEKDTANKKRRDRRAKDSKQKRREKRAAGSNSSAFRMKLQSELRALVDDVYRSARKGGSDGDLDALHWKNEMYSVFGLDKDSALIPEVGTPSDIVLLENSHIQDLKEALDTMGPAAFNQAFHRPEVWLQELIAAHTGSQSKKRRHSPEARDMERAVVLRTQE
ncbi:hypothetical protein JCM16303_000816 [Sporobolomyces ruberrimus]